MCLAPCFAGCTDAEYAGEIARVAQFLESRGAASIDDVTRDREQASAELDFERAAGLHRRLEKIASVQRALPELARSLDPMNAVVLQRAAEEQTIAIFVVRGGRIADPFFVRFGELASQPRSVEQMLRDLLEPKRTTEDANADAVHLANGTSSPGAVAADAGQNDANDANPVQQPERAVAGVASAAPAVAADKATLVQTEDQLSLLGRWFYAKPREGEIFFEEKQPAGWPYRRILRACSRVLAPPDTNGRSSSS